MNERVAEMIEFLHSNGYDMQDLANLLRSLDKIPNKCNQEKVESNNIERKVNEILFDLSIPANLLGFKYVKRAIIMIHENPKYMRSVTSVVYPRIAKEYETTNSKVERGIRHAITRSLNNIDSDVAYKYFGSSISIEKDKPTNAEFIAAIVEFLKLN